jgi:hypothetical protein
MTEKIEYNKVVAVTRDDSRLIEFLLYRLNEIPSWTKKKHALLDVIKQRLSQLNAYTYLGKAKNLCIIGDWTCGSSYHDFLKNTPLEGLNFYQLVIGYSNTKASKRQIALIVYDDKDLPTSTELFRLGKFVKYNIHALWESGYFESEVFLRIKSKIISSGYIKLEREDSGIGATWRGLDEVGEEESLQESLYVSLEGVSPDLMDVGGLYPEINMYLIQPELLAIEVVNPF